MHFCVMILISSKENPLIKQVNALFLRSRNRKATNQFIVEGWKEIQMAIQNEFVVETILLRQNSKIDLTTINKSINCVEVATVLFDEISYRGNTSKALAIVQQKKHNIKNIYINNKNGIYIIVDGVEKPGNIGAILRTADATAVDAVIVASEGVDVYNPNVIRSSVGCFFTVPVYMASKEKVHELLKNNSVQIYTTSLKAAVNYSSINYQSSCAFVFGTEATGVDVFWENNANQNIILPMLGQNDSLNVSNTVAVILYEVIRQRNTI